MYIQGNNPFKKKKTSKSITWHDSDAPDAKGKFKNLSPSGLASWLIKTRKGKLNRIIGSLNQQYVFNRGKKPSYAAKMKTTIQTHFNTCDLMPTYLHKQTGIRQTFSLQLPFDKALTYLL